MHKKLPKKAYADDADRLASTGGRLPQKMSTTPSKMTSIAAHSRAVMRSPPMAMPAHSDHIRPLIQKVTGQ